MSTMNTTDATNANTAGATQELKSSWVQEPAAVPVARKRVARPANQGDALSLSRSQREERLKSERVQLRLRQMPGWQMQKGGKAIDRVRSFPDAMSAAAYLSFSALLVRESNLPVRISMVGNTFSIELSGSSKYAGDITEDVLNLAERLG